MDTKEPEEKEDIDDSFMEEEVDVESVGPSDITDDTAKIDE